MKKSQYRRLPEPSRCQETERTSFLIEKSGGDGSISGACNRGNTEDDFSVYDLKQLGGALRSVGRIHGQALREHAAEKRRQVADMDSRRNQWLAAQALNTLSRRITAYSFVDSRAQAVDIGCGGEGTAADLLLRCRVAHVDSLPDNVVLHAASQIRRIAPVDEIHAAVPAQEAVDGTDVAVDITAGVGL